MTKTRIAWTERVWNPVTGCSKVSPGCAHCYAERMAERFGRSFEVTLHPERLDMPLAWRTPQMVFVNSVSDLFHEQVPDEFIAEVFDRMASATLECSHRKAADHDGECWQGSRHTFQILTKRPERMQDFLDEGIDRVLEHWPGDTALSLSREMDEWPLPNVWLGTSIESWRFADRADYLRATPAAVRFISAEPLLGPIPVTAFEGIDWVIVGGESGPGHREMYLPWLREVVAHAQLAGAKVFVKQDSGPRSGMQGRIQPDLWALKEMPEPKRSWWER